MKTLALLLLALGLPVAALAVDPPPGGDYPGFNTALGQDALFSLTAEGTSNTALGFQALHNTGGGKANTAVGANTLYANTFGVGNTGVGYQALGSNISGTGNTAIGDNSMLLSTAGNFNSAIGETALGQNTTGNHNAAFGDAALYSNTTGSFNIGLGDLAGSRLTTGSNNIMIGNYGNSAESNTIRVGKMGSHTNTYIAGISGVSVAAGVGVIVDSKGHLGTVVSSRRFKDHVQSMGEASAALLSLEPVTFRYKKDLDPEAIPQFGLIAEQVAKVDPDLVARDESGKPYTVRYEAVNAMLLNEFLKEHRKVEALEATVAKLQATIEKVSARVEAGAPAARLVLAGE